MSRDIFYYDFHDFFLMAKGSTDSLEPPFGSTFVIPPEFNYPKEIPVFCAKENIWKIQKNNFWFPEIIQETFYCGRDVDLYQLLEIDDLSICGKMHRPLKRGILGATDLSIDNMQRKQYINIILRKIYSNYQKQNLELFSFIENRFNIESVIHQIKKIIDNIIAFENINISRDEILKTNKIQDIKLGNILTNTQKEIKIEDIRSSLGYSSFEILFKVINDLHNSMKHHPIAASANNIAGKTEPTIYILYAKDSYNTIRILNNNLSQIITGFNDFLSYYYLNKPLKAGYELLITPKEKVTNINFLLNI